MFRKILKRDKFTSKLLIIVTVLVIITPAVFRLARPGFYSMYDDMQVIRLQQMDVCIKDGQIPCRWVPDLGLGYGYPLYQYYAPLPYYFMEAIHLLGFSYIDSVKAGFAFSIFFAALFLYLFAKRFFSTTASVLATFLYIFAPFRAQDLYVRGAMGELWGAVSVPFVLYAFERLLKEKSKLSFMLFSLAVFTFFISHNLTVLIFTPLIIAWILLRVFMAKGGRFVETRVATSWILGMCLAAFYIIPLALERNLIHIATLTSGYFGYLQHFLSIKQIFLATKWGYGTSILGPNDNAFLGIGPIHSGLAVLGFVGAVYKFGIKSKKIVIPLLLIISFLGYSFLSHERSTFIWKYFSMDIFQFPWRFVMVGVFTSSILVGYLIDIFSKKLRKVLVLLIIVITLSLYGNYFQPKDWININDKEKLSGENLKTQLTASIYDYLPKSAKRAPDEIAINEPIIIAGEVETISSQEGSNWFKYVLEVDTERAYIALPAYDFPHWKVFIEGKELATKKYGDFGLVSFEVLKGRVNVEASLVRSWPRVIGDSVSVITLLLVGWLILGKTKRWKSFTKQ